MAKQGLQVQLAELVQLDPQVQQVSKAPLVELAILGLLDLYQVIQYHQAFSKVSLQFIHRLFKGSLQAIVFLLLYR